MENLVAVPAKNPRYLSLKIFCLRPMLIRAFPEFYPFSARHPSANKDTAPDMSLITHTLANLTKALRTALRVSIECNERSENTHKILNVLRQVELTLMLHQQPIYAIAGTQGAGKTTLAKSLLGIDDSWLEANPGRGEQIPLFIEQRHDVQGDYPQFIYVCAHHKTGEIFDSQPRSGDELKQMLRDWSQMVNQEIEGGKILYPKLIINKSDSFIDEEMVWALLPGYEISNSQNHRWQGMMRHVMVNARGVLLVTDPTLMANTNQSLLVNDLRSVFADRSPVIVVTKTESLNDAEKAEVKASAAALFHATSSPVVAAGVDNKAQWTGELRAAFAEGIHNSAASEAAAIERLMALVNDDVADIIDNLNLLYAEQDSGEERTVAILEAFDKAAERYEQQLRKAIKRETDGHRQQATDYCQRRYQEEEEGLTNNLKGLGRRLILQGAEIDRERKNRVLDAWQARFEQQSLADHNMVALETLNRRELRHYGLSQETLSPQRLTSPAATMGYLSVAEEDNSSSLAPLRHLLGSAATRDAPPQLDQLSTLLKVLPAMTMEYARGWVAINQAMPAASELTSALRPQQILDAIFSAQSSIHPVKTALMAFIGADAADGTLDGEVGTPQNEDSGVFTPVAIAGKAMLVGAAVFALYQVAGVVSESDKAQAWYIERMMKELAQYNENVIIERYQDTMGDLRQLIEINLNRLFGVQDVLTQKSYLWLAIQGLTTVQKEARQYEASIKQYLA